MKRKILVGLSALALTASLLAATTYSTGSMLYANMQLSRECTYGQCIKIKKDGYQCRNCSQWDSVYCWSHRPRW